MKKYELIKESKTMFERREIYRIRALKDFGNVKAGDVGGWVCSESNLSQEGECWVCNEAKCLDNSRMYDNSIMCGYSIMYGNSKMWGNSTMYDNSTMSDNSTMYDNSTMRGYSIMYGNSIMYDNSTMYDNSIMYGNSKMYDNSTMFGNSKMYDNSTMFDYAILDENKILYGSINKSYKKIFQYHCEKRLLIAILTEVNEILYSVGCQIGMTKEEFIDRIYNDCEVKGKGLEEYPHRQEYLDMIDIVENYLRKFI